jgi:hypothetical protein
VLQKQWARVQDCERFKINQGAGCLDALKTCFLISMNLIFIRKNEILSLCRRIFAPCGLTIVIHWVMVAAIVVIISLGR